MNKKNCDHKFEPVKHGIFYQDECIKCGCEGVLARSPNEIGMYEIVAKEDQDDQITQN